MLNPKKTFVMVSHITQSRALHPISPAAERIIFSNLHCEVQQFVCETQHIFLEHTGFGLHQLIHSTF